MHCFGMLMDGRARPTGVRQRGKEATMLLVLNAHHDVVDFTLPAYGDVAAWRAVLDTNAPDHEGSDQLTGGTHYLTTGRSLVLFALL